MQGALERILDDFRERPLPDLLPRDADLPRVKGKAGVVVGMRRSGKTWFCYQQMTNLLASGVGKDRLLYINFEDERLLPFGASDFQVLLDTYYRRSPSLKGQECFLFLDEVQRIAGWDRFVRRVLDTENLAVVVTGSSSRLLSSEIATALRGRSLTTEIFPFSWREFLRYHGVEPDPRTFGSRTRARLEKSAALYLETGGFPEVQSLEVEMRRQVLRDYVDVVILRDVVERHGISNVVALRALIRQLMAAPAARFSVNKFYNALRSQGISATKNTLYDLLHHLADAYLVFEAPLHARSEHVRRVNPRKVYAIDSGLLDAMSFRMTEDRCALLENMVYLHLRRAGHQPEYYLTARGAEVDFVVTPRGRGGRQLIQACWSLSDPTTRERELRALRDAMRELRIRSATIVTWLDEDSADPGVRVVPAWKWMLEG